ncbi:MAG: GDSL-type esterase/lipase family protein [Oscillospiraceae bacterium]|jgi:lysophospholipase L1-like esterase|nr:GDSL-type esterase/lipase family protein [Oscillospiraceae bacterium]
MPTTILFQGDSVTDCGRRDAGNDPLGNGYPLLVKVAAQAAQPGAFVFRNRGTSGARVRDLRAHWREDCLDLQPDAVSILIGVNDTWRRYDQNDPTSDAAFEEDYRALLNPLRAGGQRLLLITPFLLDTEERVTRMREDLAGKQAVVRRLAAAYGAALLDADALFAQAQREQNNPPAAFAADGIHPTQEGHRLLAKAVGDVLRLCVQPG